MMHDVSEGDGEMYRSIRGGMDICQIVARRVCRVCSSSYTSELPGPGSIDFTYWIPTDRSVGLTAASIGIKKVCDSYLYCQVDVRPVCGNHNDVVQKHCALAGVCESVSDAQC